MTVDVGAVVVATGFETFDPKGMYAYGENPNVITQLQLARMLDQSGPTKGRIIRPGDGQEPKRIAMIQCVGSRDPKIHEYCSKICCGIAVKHATEIMERYPESGLAIIHKDIRLTGKHYEDYYYRAQNLAFGSSAAMSRRSQRWRMAQSTSTSRTSTARWFHFTSTS